MIFPPDRVTLVGVLNATPDSFSDGGRFADVGSAVAAGRALARDGAHVIDVGGESTRPGAVPVSAEMEMGRVVPVIEGLLADGLEVRISVDTRKAAVAKAALAAGATVVNDISGGRDPELLELAAASGAAVILGHLRGEPATMQDAIHFDDVVREVGDELARDVDRARRCGVRELVADPGLGFGKRPEHSLALLANVGALRARWGVPVMIGPSRKSFLGALTGRRAEDRDLETHVACGIGVFAGADAVRVHDVAGAARALAVARALREGVRP